jgi:SsrA-binding protein
MNKKAEPIRRIIVNNKRARFDYHIEETFEAGIMLVGSEVKSLRAGKASLLDAYAGEMEGAIYLINGFISEYSGANRFNHVEKRPRKLLLHRQEIRKLMGKIRLKGMTLVPLCIYFNEQNRAKVELGLARGKQEHDKRATIKERDWQREKSRTLKGSND